MSQKTKTILGSLSFLLVFTMSVLTIRTFAAFTPPTGSPLTNNVAAPINSSDVLQKKDGGLIVEFFRVVGLTLVGGNLEVSGNIKIYGGNPGVNKVLVSDAAGLASWRDASTLPGWGGSGGSGSTGIIPVSLGGTGLTTIPSNSIWVANSKDTITTLTPSSGNSIRINASGVGWEEYTPVVPVNGSANSLSKFLTGNTLGNSLITELSGKIGIGTTSPLEALHVIGNTRISGLAGVGERQVCVDATGKLIACSSDVSRVIVFSISFNENENGIPSISAGETRILFSSNPADLGKKVKVCNFNSDSVYKFTAHFDLPGNSCNSTTTGENIDSEQIVSTQFVRNPDTSGYMQNLMLTRFDPAVKVEFGATPAYQGDRIYFTAIWPSLAN